MKLKPVKDINPECFLNTCHNAAYKTWGSYPKPFCRKHYETFEKAKDDYNRKKKEEFKGEIQ